MYVLQIIGGKMQTFKKKESYPLLISSYQVGTLLVQSLLTLSSIGC